MNPGKGSSAEVQGLLLILRLGLHQKGVGLSSGLFATFPMEGYPTAWVDGRA